MRGMRYFIGGAVIAALGGGAGAVGTINVDQNDLVIGGAPTQGSITVDDCAPEAQPPNRPFVGLQGSIGPITDAFPDFPGGGSGADGVFDAATDMVLPGGTYEFTEYTIQNGVVVEYTGAVTIKTTGDMTINGDFETEVDNHSVTLHCGGTFRLEGQPGSEARIDTETDADITVLIAEDFRGGDDARINTNNSEITVVAHGLNDAHGRITMSGTRVNASNGDISLRAMGGFFLDSDADVNCSNADIFMQAFTGDLILDDSEVNISNGSGNLVQGAGIAIEAGGSITMSQGFDVNASIGNIFCVAFGGNYDSSGDGELNTDLGTLFVRARNSVFLREDACLNTGTGDIVCQAFGGDLQIGTSASQDDPRLNTGTGDIVCEASGNVTFENTGRSNAGEGDLLVRSFGGNVVFTDLHDFNTGSGDFDVRAFGSITANQVEFNAENVVFSAGDGGIDLDIDNGIAFAGTFLAIALGQVRLTGQYESQGDMSLVSCEAGVDIMGSDIMTMDQGQQDGTPSGDVVLQSFAGAAGVIDATDITITTGSSDVESGSISLLVHDGKIGNQPPPETIRSFLLPKKVRVTTGPAAKGPGLKAVGIFDTGTPDVDLMAPATLTLGPLVLNIPGLTPKGKSFVFKGSGVDLKVKQGGFGTSKGKFRLKFKGDFGAPVDLNGEFTVSYVGGGADAEGTVVLNNGKFSFAKIPGTLISPDLHIVKAKAKFEGVGRHPFKFVAGVAGDGVIPPMSPDICVGFGDLFNTVIDGDDVKLKGKDFVLKESPTPDGVAAIAFNFGRERVSVRGGDVDIGDVPEGVYPLLLILKQNGDADVRAVLVTGARRGKILKY